MHSLAPRRWARMMPAIFVAYSFAYVDRANFGFGAAAGMANDLQISGQTNALLGALFFLGYFLFQVPGAIYAERHSARRLVFWSMIAWGVLASATGLLHDIRLLMLDRFLLGVVESAVLPCMLILLSHWFTRAERSRANTLLILGNPITVLWMSVVSGYLVDLAGWRGMFIIEGVPAILWAFAWLRLVHDEPGSAAWLGPDEAAAVTRQLVQEQKDVAPVRDYPAAFRTPSVWLLAAQYLFWSIGIYGFILWLPTILKTGSSAGIVAVGWLSAVPYLVASLLMLAASFVSDRTLVRRGVVWPFMLIGAVALYGSYRTGGGNYWLAYGLLVIAGAVMYAPYGPFFAWITELLPRNVAGGAIALVNSFGALGSFIGTYVVGFLHGATGNDDASFLFMAGSLAVATVLTLAVRQPQTGVVSGVPAG